MISIFVHFKDGRRQTTFLKAHKTCILYFDTLFVIYQLSEIKDDFQVVSSFPCLLGHPVNRYILNLVLRFRNICVVRGI